MKLRLLLATLATVLAAGVAATAAPDASAATTYTVNETFVVGGYDVTLGGDLTVNRFSASGSTITASATFNGQIAVPALGISAPVNATLTVTLTNVQADCATGTVRFDLTATLTLTRPIAFTYTFTTPVTISVGSNTLLRNFVCQIAALNSGSASTSAVVDKLNLLQKKAA